MGDVIKTLTVRSSEADKSRKKRLYFDNGSPFTFIKESATKKFSAVYKLPQPIPFYGLGNGEFKANQFAHLEIMLSGFWCRHSAYVVSDEDLEDIYDALIGHDFMQKFNVGINSRKRDIIINKGSLKMAQRIRTLITRINTN